MANPGTERRGTGRLSSEPLSSREEHRDTRLCIPVISITCLGWFCFHEGFVKCPLHEIYSFWATQIFWPICSFWVNPGKPPFKILHDCHTVLNVLLISLDSRFSHSLFCSFLGISWVSSSLHHNPVYRQRQHGRLFFPVVWVCMLGFLFQCLWHCLGWKHLAFVSW